MRSNLPPRKGAPKGPFRGPGRGGRKPFDPDFALKKRLRMDVMRFLTGDENRLDLPPLNSYERKIAHEVAGEFRLESTSEGEGIDRHNVFIRTAETYQPTPEEIEDSLNQDHGNEEFFIASGTNGVEITLYEDGSFGIFEDERESAVMDRKFIDSGSFKIKNNAIVSFTDPEW